MKINLPESRNAETAPSQESPLVLSVQSASEMTLDNQPVTMEMLTETVRKAIQDSPKRPFALRADREAAFGEVVQVIDALRDAGISNIPAFTQPQSTP